MNKAEVYTKPFPDKADAVERGLWRASFRANIHCAMAIEKAVSENFDGEKLPTVCVDRVIDAYGIDRVKWVLAATIQEAEHDGWFSRENKAWASVISVPPDEMNYAFCVKSQPGLTDIFMSIVRGIDQTEDLAEGKSEDMTMGGMQ